MTEKFERKCIELFGYCPLSIGYIASIKTLGYSETDLLYEAARKHYLIEQYNFLTALWDWKDGKKMQITKEEAEKRNHYFNNAKVLVDEKFSLSTDTPVDWMDFPNDDPTICYYLGLPLDYELCVGRTVQVNFFLAPLS